LFRDKMSHAGRTFSARAEKCPSDGAIVGAR
jgi:hypothetical protein